MKIPVLDIERMPISWRFKPGKPVQTGRRVWGPERGKLIYEIRRVGEELELFSYPEGRVINRFLCVDHERGRIVSKQYRYSDARTLAEALEAYAFNHWHRGTWAPIEEGSEVEMLAMASPQAYSNAERVLAVMHRALLSLDPADKGRLLGWIHGNTLRSVLTMSPGADQERYDQMIRGYREGEAIINFVLDEAFRQEVEESAARGEAEPIPTRTAMDDGWMGVDFRAQDGSGAIEDFILCPACFTKARIEDAGIESLSVALPLGGNLVPDELTCSRCQAQAKNPEAQP